MSEDYGTEALLDGNLDPTAHARTSDPYTSLAAARALSPKATMLRALLSLYGRAPAGATAEQAARQCGYTAADGAWKRVSDLRNAGYLEDTGLTRTGSSGRRQQVLQITDAGRASLR